MAHSSRVWLEQENAPPQQPQSKAPEGRPIIARRVQRRVSVVKREHPGGVCAAAKRRKNAAHGASRG